jgi:CRP-like cAMP-binding protein
MNYYIPSTLINEELVYKQEDESDSFYIIQEGIFDVYCEISIDEFSKYKRYLLKDNKSIIDWIKGEKENKNKISVEKIIDYMQWKMKIEEYPEKKDIIDKNMFYIKKNLLNKDEENDEQLINLKVNEEILKEKNKKFRIKLFTFHKNDFIGLEDSLELKSRFYNVECVSDRGMLNKIRILDFIVFIASNHGLDLHNIINYVKERKTTIIDRIYSNLIRKLDSNKRIINNAISLALSSYEKRNNIFIKSKNENMNEVNFTNKRNNKFTDKIPYFNQTSKRLNTFNQFNAQRKKSASIRRSILLNQLAKNEVKKNNMPKLEWRFNYDLYEKEKIIYQPNISIYLARNSPDKKNKDRSKVFQYKDNTIDEESSYLKNISFSKSKNLFQRNIKRYKLTQSIYDKLIVRNRNKNSSYNNKIDKEICNMTGIYNTKRELFKKKLLYLSSSELKKHRKIINNYKLSQSNEIKKRQPKAIFAVLSITDITDGINSIKKNSKKFPITKHYSNLKLQNNKYIS